MGLFGALFTSVSGTQAQSQQTALISDNIANVSTVGFKRTDASFRSLVTTQTNSGRYSPGSVISDRQLRASIQGALRQTGSATDVAVSGNGFFVVRPSATPNPDQEFLYTRNGEFFEDEQGFLRNTAGFVLYGVPIVEEGVTPDFSDLSQLQAVDATTISQNSRITTNAELAINLNSETPSYNNDIDAGGPGGPPTQLPVPIDGATGVASDFTRTLPVFDSLGTAQELVFDFRKVLGPQANATFSIQNIEPSDILSSSATVPGALPGINDGDAIQIEALDPNDGDLRTTIVQFDSDPTNPTTPVIAGATVVQTLQDFINVVNGIGPSAAPTGVEMRQNGNDELVLQAVNPETSLEINTLRGNPLGASGLNLIPDTDTLDADPSQAQYIETSTGNIQTATGTPPTIDLTTPLLSDPGYAGLAAGDTLDLDITLADGTVIPTVSTAAGDLDPTTTLADFAASLQGALDAQFAPDASPITVGTTVDGRLSLQKDDPLIDVQVSGTAADDPAGNDFGFSDTITDFVFNPEAPIQPTTGTTYGTNDPYPNQDDFPAFSNTVNPNTQGWWEVTITQPNGNEVTRGLINFASDATLNATPNAEDEIVINLENLNFGNGSDTTQDIAVDIERFSSFAGANNVIFSDQNGAEVGLRTGVEITDSGVVVAQFSNGTSAELFQIPLATFANPNGLNPESGTAFSETEDSGEENLNAPGSGGSGFLEASTLEQSNVDLADEFAKLIITQRAFTANTRTINTVDELTEELLRLR